MVTHKGRTMRQDDKNHFLLTEMPYYTQTQTQILMYGDDPYLNNLNNIIKFLLVGACVTNLHTVTIFVRHTFSNCYNSVNF